MKKTKRIKKQRSRRGIYILPNIITSLNLFCGFYAVIASIDGKFIAASMAIIIGVLFDIMDGKIARATSTASKFGIEYDSLSDLISFGLAPGIMIYLWALRPLGRIGWMAAFLFMACGALRLARFNSQVGFVSSDHFVGLPIPAAAGMLATTVLFCHKFGTMGKMNPIFILVLLYILSFLMVSTIKYSSFKKPELFRKMNFNVLVAVGLILIFTAAQPSSVLFILGLIYVILGAFITLQNHRRIKQKTLGTVELEKHTSSSI